MPVELIERVIVPVAGLVFYWTGRPVVRVVSLGWLHVSFLVELDATADPPRRRRRWPAITFIHNNKRYVSSEAATVLGAAIWFAAIAAAIRLTVYRE